MSAAAAPATTTADNSLTPGAKGWDSCAQKYAREAVHLTGPPARNALTEGLCLLGQSEGVRLGDIACGSGCVSRLASDLPQVSTIAACDYSQGMVDIVAKEVKAASSKPVAAFVADAGDLAAIATGSLDLAVMAFALMLLPAETRERAAAEMVRVVRPGGLVVFTTWVEADRSQFMSVIGAINRNYAKLAHEKAVKADPTATLPALTNAQAVKMPFNTLDSFTELFASLSLKTELLTTFTAPTRLYDGIEDFGNAILGMSPVGFQQQSNQAEFIESLEFLAALYGRHSKFTFHATSILAIGRKQ